MSERLNALGRSVGHALGVMLFSAIGGFFGLMISPYVGGFISSFIALVYIFMAVQGQLS